MRKFKRIISGLLLVATITTSLLALLPPIEVRAAENPEVINLSMLNKRGFYIDPNINGFWDALDKLGRKLKLMNSTDSSDLENMFYFSDSTVTVPNMYADGSAADDNLDDWNVDNSGVLREEQSNSNLAYESYLKIFEGLKAQNGGTLKFNYVKTFDFDDKASFKKYIYTFANGGKDIGSDLDSMPNIMNIYKSFVDYGNNEYIWIGCDFNTDNGLFYYYYHFIDQTAGQKDDYATCMLISNRLYKVKDGEADEDRTSGTTIEKNLVKALQSLVNHEGKTNIFKVPFMTGTEEDYIDPSTFQHQYDLINNHISVVPNPDDPGKVNMKLIWGGSIGWPRHEDISGGCGTDSLDIGRPTMLTNCTVDLGADDWVNFSDASAMTGTGKLVEINNDLDKDKLDYLLASLTADIINGSAAAGNSGLTTEMIPTIALNISEDKHSPKPAYTYTAHPENSYIYTIYTTWADVLAECIQASGLKIEFDSLTDLTELEGKSDYEIMNAIIQMQIASMCNGSTIEGTFRIGEVGYVFRLDGEDDARFSDFTSMKELFGSSNITNQQRAQLATAYRLKLESINKSLDYDRFTMLLNYYAMNVEGNYTAVEDNIITSLMIEETNDLLETYTEQELSSNGTATNALKVANVLVRYAFISSVINLNEDGTNIENIATIYNATLENMVASPFIYAEGQQDYWSTLPKHMDGIMSGDAYKQLLFDNDGELKTWNRIISALYNVEYAASICAFSEQGEKTNITPEALKQWFNTGTVDEEYTAFIDDLKSSGVNPSMDSVAAQNANFANNPISLCMLRCIIEVYDLCKFLGVGKGDWSESIDAYLDIYESNKAFFEALRLNTNIFRVADTGKATIEEPLGKFFNIANQAVTDQWTKGFALSSLYVPMETNLYDAESIAFLSDPDWISNFYYKYAFFRKALYVNTDSSAIVNEFVTGDKSSTKVATLKDLLNYDRDIVLYVDDNFYNAREINSVIENLDYTNIRAEANRDQNTEENPGNNFSTSIGNAFSELLDLSASQILKTDSNAYYSENLAKNVTKFSTLKEDPLAESLMDVYILSKDDILGNADSGIESALDSDEYSVKQSYAVVSAVYRDAELYNTTLRAIASDNAIFKSSSAICSTPGTGSKDWISIYNYYMLANLEEQMKNDVATTLDLDAPIFCDLFGNIITESGLVIIPAASNATLCNTNWTPYNMGFSEYYNNGIRIPDGKYSDEFYTWLIGDKYSSSSDPSKDNTQTAAKSKKENAGGFMMLDRSGVFVLRTTSLNSNNLSALVQWENLNKNSAIIQQLFYNHNYFECGMKLYCPMLVNLIVEVLRGAPIEYIDYTIEGLEGSQNISKFGVYIAYKLEEITKSLMPSTNGDSTGGNSVITMPNLAFVDGIEVYMLYAYKITFAVMVVGLAVSLYMDAVRNRLGVKSVIRFIITCVGVLVSFTLLPELISWSYYNANKTMLSEEAGHIMMLNYVKDLDGAEIGVAEITTPESATDLYLKVGNFDLDWWSIVGDVLFDNTVSSVSELYDKQLQDNTLAGQAGVILKADGLYMDVQDIYDSTAINYSPTNNVLTNTSIAYASEGINYTDTVASYVSPYYVFLDHLLNSINEYNVSKKVTSLSWQVGANGHVLTYDTISPYLTSGDFLEEGFDILGLYHIYSYLNKGVPSYGYNFDESDVGRMKLSYWYTEYYTEEIADYKIQELYDYARDYILINKELIGKVPDEVFLKTFAMQLAIKYNELFEVGLANSVEIMNVDTRDLLRFVVASPEHVYKNYSYSWARFAYEQCGGFGVVLCAILLFLIWLTSYIKPLLMLVILGLLIVNIVCRKLLFGKESRSIEGYLIGCACLCICNYIYSIMLKVTMSINALGLGSVTALILAMLTQVIYVLALLGIVFIEVKDWKNNGFNEFRNIGSTITSNMLNVTNMVADKFHSLTNESYKATRAERRSIPFAQTRSLSDMFKRDEQRIMNSEDNIN